MAYRRQLHLSLFIGIGDEGGFGGWRRQTSRAEELTSLSLYRELAERAEAAKFDAVFKADSLSLDANTIASEPSGLEPIVLLSALAAATSRIGLIGTISSSFTEPFNVARQLATLDHLSGGRAGWNLVTSAWGEENFGRSPLPPQEVRYERAAEFLDVTKALWDSWDDEALLRDRESGSWADPARIRRVDHDGKYFSVAGPLNLPRTPQGHPVIVQAGASESGRAFAAGRAEVVFTAAPTLAGAQAFYADIRRRAEATGRHPDGLRIMPGLKPYVGGTEAEAHEIYRELADKVDLVEGRAKLETWMGMVDLSGLEMDEPIPAKRLALDHQLLVRRQSRPALLQELALEERRTLRQMIHLVRDSNGHRSVIGTPVQVADQIETWFQQRGADGFNIMPAYPPDGVFRFLDEVVPILQERGTFRTEYEGATLRHHLGLPRPAGTVSGSPSFDQTDSLAQAERGASRPMAP